MNVLIFCSEKQNGESDLHRIIGTFQQEIGIEAYRTLPHLKSRLCDPRDDIMVAVLFASTHDTLNSLLSIRDMLTSLPIILILPEDEPDSFSKGHKLYPRFISSINNGLSDVEIVLKNIISKSLEI